MPVQRSMNGLSSSQNESVVPLDIPKILNERGFHVCSHVCAFDKHTNSCVVEKELLRSPMCRFVGSAAVVKVAAVFLSFFSNTF